MPSGVACSFSSVAVVHVATSWQCRRFLGAAASAFFVLLDTRLCITHSRPCITLSLLGRSSVATWLIRIVLNRARARAGREGRLAGPPAWLDATEPGGGAAGVTEFQPDGHWSRRRGCGTSLIPNVSLATGSCETTGWKPSSLSRPGEAP